MKKVFYGFLAIVLAFSLATGCSCEKKEKEDNNQSIINDNSNLEINDTKVNELDIIDFVVFYEDEISDISFTIANNTEETVTYNEIECNMYNKNKELLHSFTDEVGPLEAMDEKEITYRVNLDLTKVAEVEYVLR